MRFNNRFKNRLVEREEDKKNGVWYSDPRRKQRLVEKEGEGIMVLRESTGEDEKGDEEE